MMLVALNNQFYTFGETKLTEELKDLKRRIRKAILTILRDNVFFDIIVNKQGCKFLQQTTKRLEKIKTDFAKKENFDLEELNESCSNERYFRRYDVFDNSNLC